MTLATFISAGAPVTTRGATLTIPAPAGTIIGDMVLVLAWSSLGTSADLSTALPSGWAVLSRLVTANGQVATLLRRIATSIEPTSHVFAASFDGSHVVAGVAMAYRGIDPSHTLMAAAVSQIASTTLFISPSVVPVASSDLYIGAAFASNSSTTSTAPGGTTERVNQSATQDGAAHLEVFESKPHTIDPTGTKTSTFSLSVSGVAISYVIRSAEQELADFALGALPSWMRSQDEMIGAMAVSIGAARAHGEYLFSQALITQATGATADSPDWLDQHARDRGTSRQAGETDPVLQQRLRVVPDAITSGAILDAANAILAAAGVVGSAALVELPRDAAWIGVNYAAMSGTGGTFTASPVSFTPSALPWAAPPWISPVVLPAQRSRIVIASATHTGNNGTFEITGLSGNAVLYANGSAFAGSDGAATWTVQHMDALGNVTDGFARSFCGRGWRAISPRPFTVLVILPFGTSAGVAASVTESVRLKKAAGYRLIVERRMNP